MSHHIRVGMHVDPVEVRCRIRIVFPKKPSFPKVDYENITFGVWVNEQEGNLDELVERSPSNSKSS
ncbi:MAG: hypothetical protein HC840_10995 [Leptolyngbyaceae cyanobacterium RM2_2_4]|nr:hypothetical protein [Leptolyngbyaceae cyanobacterium RM2_2_4]